MHFKYNIYKIFDKYVLSHFENKKPGTKKDKFLDDFIREKTKEDKWYSSNKTPGVLRRNIRY